MHSIRPREAYRSLVPADSCCDPAATTVRQESGDHFAKTAGHAVHLASAVLGIGVLPVLVAAVISDSLTSRDRTPVLAAAFAGTAVAALVPAFVALNSLQGARHAVLGLAALAKGR